MNLAPPLLDIRNLSIAFPGHDAVRGLDLTINARETLALVGESGCGKTTTMLSLMRLLPAEGRIVSGKMLYNEVDLLSLSERDMGRYRWRQMAIVFQGAMNALNPVRQVGDQISEAVRRDNKIDRRAARLRVGELMEMVGIPPERAAQYPHQFSGGMRQRAMIAMALACQPEVLIADEPTTALDVMIQAQILELLKNLQQQLGLAVVLVTHDLGVVAEVCDQVLVMYGGKTAEYGSVDTIFNQPIHPYTQRLLRAFPDVDNPDSTLTSIAGHPPPLDDLPLGCRFEPRCPLRSEICANESPALRDYGKGHLAACHHPEES